MYVEFSTEVALFMACDDILTACPLFAGVDRADLGAMMGCLGAAEIAVKKNRPIFEEGGPARSVGILLSGRAQIVRTDYYGNRSIMASVAPGELFGEAFACADVEALPVSVIAAEDSRALLIDVERIMTACDRACSFHSQMIYNLLKIVANKNLVLHQRAEITSRRTTRDKLMTYLLLQAKRTRSDVFDIPFDRQGLADFLEVDRSGLSAEIGRLKKAGVLDCHKNRFRLLEPMEQD